MNPDEEIAALEQLIDSILAEIENAAQNGEEISDELQGMIAEELMISQQRISELQGQSGQSPENPTAPTDQFQPSDSASLLWVLAGGREDAFVEYLQTFPDPSLQNLLRNPTLLEQTIRHLHANDPLAQNIKYQQADGIPHAEINSSNIYGFQHDPRTGKLLVRFNSGAVYSYDNVPKNVYSMFERGAIPAKTDDKSGLGRFWKGKKPSLGASFHELIKLGGYPYQRLQ